jgi:hypothetical protein
MFLIDVAILRMAFTSIHPGTNLTTLDLPILYNLIDSFDLFGTIIIT